jgi:hypothetical protein
MVDGQANIEVLAVAVIVPLAHFISVDRLVIPREEAERQSRGSLDWSPGRISFTPAKINIVSTAAMHTPLPRWVLRLFQQNRQ